MDMLIGGKHISSEDLQEVKNPYDGEIIDMVPIAHRQTADLAIQQANIAKKDLAEMSAFKISNKLFNVVDKLRQNRTDFAELLSLEVGKPINESLVELDRSIETLKLAAEEAKRVYGESVPLDAGLNGKGFFAFTQRLPLGVVAAITPFNYPLNLTIHKIAPAIACKNTVIVKPPTEAPLTVMKFCELLDEEFPDGVVNTVTGYGSEIGDYLVTSPEINKISFTGSVTTGMMISQKAGMKKVTLELGGNDPMVVLKDADIDKAVKGVINGAFLNAGQVCMGVKRIIIEDEIADEFCNRLVSETEKFVMGNPLDSKTTLGTLISEKAAIQVEETVNNAVGEGAKILTGGNRDGAFYEATVVDNVVMDMDLVAFETFGPVAPIIRVNSVQEAIDVANDTFRTDNMPFGGFKNSGVGKEGIKYAVEEMTKTKLIGLNLR